MKRNDFSKIYDNGQIIVIGLSKAVVTTCYDDTDVVMTFNLALQDERNRFIHYFHKYNGTDDEMYEVILRAYLLFD